VRVVGSEAAAVSFPDSLELPQDLESAGPRRLRADTTEAGERWTAVYPVTGWKPGRHELPPAAISLDGGTTVSNARFPEVIIASVLPADTAGVQPKPARDVLGGNRVWWPWLLLAALLASLAAAFLYWYRRRHAREHPVIAVPTRPARVLALEALERARASGAVEAGDFKRFYSDVSAALRGYLAAVDPALGTDLTTTEVLLALRQQGRSATSAGLGTTLQAADMVKFAQRRPGEDVALQDWQRARDWVLGFDAAPELESAA